MSNPFADNAGIDLSSIYAMSLLGNGAPPVTQPGGGNTTGSGGNSAGLESVNGGTAPTTGTGAPTAGGSNVFNTPFSTNPATGQRSSPQDLVNSSWGLPESPATVVGRSVYDPATGRFTDPQGSGYSWGYGNAGSPNYTANITPAYGPWATAALNMEAQRNLQAHGVNVPNAGADVPLPSEVGGTGEAHAAVANYYNTLGSRGLLGENNTLMQVYGAKYGDRAMFAGSPVEAGGLGFSPQQIQADTNAYYASQGMTPQPQQSFQPYTGGGVPPAAQGAQPVPIGGGMYGPPQTAPAPAPQSFPTMNPGPAPTPQSGQNHQGRQAGNYSGNPAPQSFPTMNTPPPAAPPQQASQYAAAIPKLRGYITNLQGVQHPTGAQQAELSAYQQRLASYQGAPTVSQPAPRGQGGQNG